MAKIIQMETEADKAVVRDLFWERVSETQLIAEREFNVSLDINTIFEQDMAKLQQYTPPLGRLLLAYEGNVAGCACLRKINEDIGELKRMYVRPEYRRKGIGRSLLQAIIHEARQIGYSKIRLNSAPFSKAAHALYNSAGFQNIQPYPENKVQKKAHSIWVFMEMVL